MAVLTAALVAGVALIVVDDRPRTVAAAMPPPVQWVWEVALLVTGVVGLAGIYWPWSPIVAVTVEMGAMVLLGTATCMYAIALYVIAGTQAIPAGAFVTGIGLASWWRAGQIWRDLRLLARLTREP